MGFENIHKHSLRYALLKIYGRLLHNYIFYKKVYVNGVNNIPKNKPLIITANHQNALMDSLAIGYAADHQLVWLARSDIFAKPLIARFLRFVKIMPVYRIRDGIQSLGKNENVFNNAVNVLKHNKRVAIMPEGNHGNQRKLRPLKKGAARIAFMAEEQTNFEMNLQVLPVGLDYGHYTNFRTSLFVNIGKPFYVNEFKDLYFENQQKAYLKFNEKLKGKISELIIDIQNEEYYDTYYMLREIYNAKMRSRLQLKRKNLKNRFIAGKNIISLLDHIAETNPDLLNELKKLTESFHKKVEKAKLKFWVFENKRYSFLLLFFETVFMLLLLPVHIYGLITNYLPYKIPVWLTNKIKDRQFVSSIKYVLLLIIFIIFYAIEYIIFSFFTDSLWIRNVFLLSLPLAGFFTIENWILFKKLRSKWIYNLWGVVKHKNLTEMVQLRNQIISLLDHQSVE